MKTGCFSPTSYIIQPMSAALGLFRLQQVDRQMERARAELETIRKALENDAELKQALSRLDEAQSGHHRAEQQLKNAEAEASAQRIKIEQANAALYGGNVKNPKELQDLQMEVASLKKHLVTLEERQLEAMLAAETAETELQHATTSLETVQARLGNEHKTLVERQSALSAQVEQLTEERQAALAPIEASLLQTYDDLRRQKRGLAITEVEDNACAACGTTINASVQQNARSQKQLAYCPSCGRILFAN
jgi:uncharacterized protein